MKNFEAGYSTNGDRSGSIYHDSPERHLHQSTYTSSVDGTRSVNMPPLPSPSPITPAVTSRPISYLPRLKFPDNILSKTELLTPPPAASYVGAKPQARPLFGSKILELSSAAETRTEPPTSTVLSQLEPSRDETTSEFVFNEHNELADRHSTATSANGRQSSFSTSSQVFSVADDLKLFPEDDLTWQSGNSERAIIRDSVVSKQRVSIFQPLHDSQDLPGSSQRHSHTQSVTALSTYSPEAPAHGHTKSNLYHTRTRSRSQSNGSGVHSPSTSISRSNSHPQSTSAHDITRTRDSHHQRSDISTEQDKGPQPRTRGGDQTDYNNKSNLGQGLSVDDFDFDYPFESPFSNSHAVPFSIHSKTSSYSSVESAAYNGGGNKTPKTPQQPSHLSSLIPPTAIDKDRLSVATSLATYIDKERQSVAMSLARVRSASDASQSSIGDFYDSYYRQSVATYRASNISTHVEAPLQPITSRRRSESLVRGQYESGQWPIPETAEATQKAASPSPSNQDTIVNPMFHLPFGKRRPPLLDLGKLGGGLGASRTIAGLPSPGPSSESPVIGRYASNLQNPFPGGWDPHQ